MSIAKPKPTNITPIASPHGSHGPKQGNPSPNAKNKPSLAETPHSENDHPILPAYSSTSPMSKYEPKPPKITLCESPDGIYGLKQGNPFPNSKTKSQPLPNKMTQS